MTAEPGDWQRWFEAHGAALLLFARQWSSSLPDAEDLVQEAFVRFWKTRQGVNDPRAYLFACVKAAALDGVRSRKRREAREHEVAAPPEPPLLTSTLEDDERRRRVESALAKLPADQRQVVVLKVWGELTFTQIGEALAIPLNTAASRYRYGLAALRQQLSRELSHE